MRSVWFSLIGTTAADVENELRHQGFVQSHGSEEFRYPSDDAPTLYVSCDNYQWVEEYGLQDEYAELLEAIGGMEPSVPPLSK